VGVVALAGLAACASTPEGDLEEEDDALSTTAGFRGGLRPRNAPYGGFGGGACQSTRMPVVFVHGNGDSAAGWSSVRAAFVKAGYTDCDLFGITWLSAIARKLPQGNFHDGTKADRIADFVDDVLKYTAKSEVDVIGHSMGVTVSLHALERRELPVRRFIGIAGGIRGLDSCLLVGPANPVASTCGSQNVFDAETFGFYPAFNPRMEEGGFRAFPASHPATKFFTIRAGSHDEIVCNTGADCDSSLFVAGANVRAQLDVGEGHPVVKGFDDSEGVGHFRARSRTGDIQVAMLTTDCQGTACCANFTGRCDR